MSSSYLILRSKDRSDTNSPNPNSVIITPSTSYFSQSSINSFVPESFQMLYDIPNINARNNVMVLDDGTTSYPITVAESFYDFNTLAAAILVQLNLLGLGAFAFTWNTATYRFNMTSPVPIRFTKYPPQIKDLTAMVGFQHDTALSTSYIGGYADLCYTRDIYICSTALHRSKKVIDQCSDTRINDVLMIVTIYDSEEFKRSNALVATYDYLLNPRNVFHEPHNPKLIHYNINDSIPSIDIRLLDDQGEILYNPYGVVGNDWRLSLLINKL